MLFLALYYIVVLATVILAWPNTYGAAGCTRILWIALGVAILALPLALPGRIGFYYGLTLNTTVFFWASDTYTYTNLHWEDRRYRGITGGFVVCLLPLISSVPTASWLTVGLVPTIGHLLVSGVATPVLRRLARPSR